MSVMEQFSLAAQHSGVITHSHAIHFSSSAVDIAREIKYITGIVVLGWVAVATIQAVRGTYNKETR